MLVLHHAPWGGFRLAVMAGMLRKERAGRG